MVGDVLEQLAALPDENFHCVVTSPPYWNLRDYGVEGQLGMEPTPDEHVTKMVGIFREVRRVLRSDGVCFLNYGDSYASAAHSSERFNERWHGKHYLTDKQGETDREQPMRPKTTLKPKNMVGMPWRIALALQADGWWLRSDIIWAKPNPMPESCTDRPTSSHEHVFLLTKKARYFYDAEAVRTTHAESSKERFAGSPGTGGALAHVKDGQRESQGSGYRLNPSGANLRDVWTIPTQSFPDAHFATFPEKLVEPCIKAGTSEKGCCPRCGAPWQRIVEKGAPDDEHKKACGNTAALTGNSPSGRSDLEGRHTESNREAYKKANAQIPTEVKERVLEGMRHRRTTGWKAICTHYELPEPCRVLDPFAGSGTVGLVALRYGREFVGIELSEKYAHMAGRRIMDDAPLFNMEK